MELKEEESGRKTTLTHFTEPHTHLPKILTRLWLVAVVGFKWLFAKVN